MQVQKFDQINTLRFFAVLPVLVVHWGLFDFSKSAEFSFAANGVNLFFAISGFLITLGLIRNKTDTEKSTGASLWKFYVRRVLRIFPIYYLMLLLLWFFNHGKVADGIWWYLTYTTNFYIIKIQDWGGACPFVVFIFRGAILFGLAFCHPVYSAQIFTGAYRRSNSAKHSGKNILVKYRCFVLDVLYAPPCYT